MRCSLSKGSLDLQKNWYRFLFCGIINTAVTYLVYYILKWVLHYQLAYIIAYVSGIVLSYTLNTIIVFKKTLAWKKLFQYPVVYVIQYSLSAVLMWVFIQYFNVNESIAPLMALVLTIPISYLLSKLIIVTKTEVLLESHEGNKS